MGYNRELERFYNDNKKRYYQHRTKFGQKFVLIQQEGLFINEEFFRSKLAAKVVARIDKFKSLFNDIPIRAYVTRELPTSESQADSAR